MKKKQLIALGLAMVFTAASFAGCTSDKNETPQDAQQPAAEQTQPETEEKEEEVQESSGIDANQYLITWLENEPATLDPTKCADTYGNDVLYNLTERLTVYQLDANGNTELAPAGAESWDISEDGTVYTFTLRENYWEDGQKVTAADYEYGIKRAINPETGSPTSYLLAPIKNAESIGAGDIDIEELGVKALDENTLEITLEAATPYFLSLTYQTNMSPIRQDFAEQHGDKFGSEAEYFLSNGPFKLTGWTHNSEIALAKNDEFWNADNVKLQDITYKVLEDENARHNSFDNNSVDAMAISAEEWIDRFEAKPDVVRHSYTLTQTNYSFFNAQDDIFKNANIRKAFILSIDREGFNDAIFSGNSDPAYAWVPKGIAVGGDVYRDNVEEPLRKLFAENDDPKALLLQGMEELGLGDDPSTLNIKWSLGGTTQRMRTIGEYFQQVLKQNLGVNLEVELNEWPMFQSKIVAGDFQIGYMAWGAEYNDPYSMLSLLISDSNAINTGWVSEEYDSIMKEASMELDDAKRTELYKQAENLMLYEEGVINPVLYATRNLFVYDYVQNYPNRPQLTGGFRNVYIDGRE